MEEIYKAKIMITNGLYYDWGIAIVVNDPLPTLKSTLIVMDQMQQVFDYYN